MMKKINILALLIITSLISGCGFHTPYKKSALNAYIVSDNNNIFAKELSKRFDKNLNKRLVVHIGQESAKKQTASYNSSGKTSSYTISVSVPVKVFDLDKKLLFSKNMSASSHLGKMNSNQADRLQVDETYTQLRQTIIKKLIRRLNRLNEN